MSDARSYIPWRRRTDVVVRARREDGRGGYVAHDPIAMRYFQLGDEAHFVWSRLDGRQTAEAVCAAFLERFAPRQLSVDELQRFVGQLITQGLVIGERSGMAAVLDDRAQRQWWMQAVSQWLNVLTIRFRGVNPDRFLSWLLPWCGWMFSPWTLAAMVMLWVLALGLCWVHAGEFLADWPQEVAQWTVQDLWTLTAVLAITKILHELSHSLTCKRFGGTVPEIGVMLLVFTPCLYCNVSDAWLIRSKWQRIAVSAAGVMVDATLAATATWLWWASVPGEFHALCLQVMLICGVSTVVFNLNPLMRYDGYFILADWLDQPNLHQQSAAALTRKLRAFVLGIPVSRPDGMTAAREWRLAAFALLSWTYRLFIVVAILWGLYRWLEPQGYAVVAQFVIAGTVLTMAVAGLQAVPPAMRGWGTLNSRERWGMGARLVVIAALAIVVLLVPLPSRVFAPVLLEPAAAEMIHTTRAGWLTRISAPGEPAADGFRVAELFDPGARRELDRSIGELKRAQIRLATIQRQQVNDPHAALQRPAAEQNLNDRRTRFEQQSLEHDRYVLRATRDGVFWPAITRKDWGSRHQLPKWTGSLNDEQNRGAWLAAGTTIGIVGPADTWEAIAYLPQSQVMELKVGQPARLVLDSGSDTFYEGTLTELAIAETPILEAAVADRLKLPSVPTPQGNRLVGTWYRARVEIHEGEIPPVRRLGGTVAIRVPPQSLWQRAQRWFWATFPALR